MRPFPPSLISCIAAAVLPSTGDVIAVAAHVYRDLSQVSPARADRTQLRRQAMDVAMAALHGCPEPAV